MAANGDLYIADQINVRRVTFAPDHTPATIQRVPYRTPFPLGFNASVHDVAIDAAGFLYVADQYNIPNIWRYDPATGSSVLLVGVVGDPGPPGYVGPAPLIDFNFVNAESLATDSSGRLYVGTATRSAVYRIDPASLTIESFAGSASIFGFSGDGGQATAARLNTVGDMAAANNGDLYISDYGNHRIRKVVSDIVPTPLLATISPGSAPSGTSVAVTITGTHLAGATLNTGTAIQAVNVTVASNTLITATFNIVGTTAGPQIITVTTPGGTSNALSFTILLPTITDVSPNAGVAGISIPVTITGSNLGNVTGVRLDDGVAVSAQATVASNIQVTATLPIPLNAVSGPHQLTVFSSNGAISNALVFTINSPPVIPVILTITDGTTQAYLDSLTTVNGDLVLNLTTRTTLSLPNLTNLNGSLIVTGNSLLGSLDVPNLRFVSGNIYVSNNTLLTSISSPLLASVGGNLTVKIQGQGIVDFSGAAVAGSISIGAINASSVSATTGVAGSSAVTLVSGPASMNANLPIGAFSGPTGVNFSVSHLAPASLPTTGTTLSAEPVNVAPLAAYGFTFATPTLNQNAALTFDVVVTGLPPADQVALLAALPAGNATLATLGDAAASTWQTFPVCPVGQLPSAGGCVAVTPLDVNGAPLPSGSSATPAIVRFSNLVGHFSTWGVVLTTPIPPADTTPPVFSNIPANIIAEATSPAGAVVSYTAPTASDAVSGTVAVTCTPASGASFALGVNPVNCTASDAAGNSASAGFNVTVNDTTPPAISSVPANITITAAAGATGAIATWTAPTASDLVSGIRPLTCAPASGSSFLIGTASVNCSASDIAGNSASSGFNVTVLAAPPPPVVKIRTLYAILGGVPLLDLDTFAFQGVKGEKVTVRLASNPSGTYSGSNAVLTMFGNGVLKIDNSALPNVVTVTLPKTGTYYVTVSETLRSSGRFKGAYGVSLESTLNAYSTFVQK